MPLSVETTPVVSAANALAVICAKSVDSIAAVWLAVRADVAMYEAKRNGRDRIGCSAAIG